MSKIGVITFSDGRPHVHQELLAMNLKFQENLVKKLQQEGHEVIIADEPPWTNQLAVSAGKKCSLLELIVQFLIMPFGLGLILPF